MTTNNDPNVILLPYLLSVLQNNGTVSLLNFVKLLTHSSLQVALVLLGQIMAPKIQF